MSLYDTLRCLRYDPGYVLHYYDDEIAGAIALAVFLALGSL